MAKTFMGVRLQRLREERGITQVALAKSPGISPSYLNQIEHNQRPLTVPVLLRIHSQLGLDPQLFSKDDESRLIAEVREVLADAGSESISTAELRSLAAILPAVACSILELHRRARSANDRADGLLGALGDQQRLPSFSMLGQHEEVRDYLNRRHNHVEELDEAAETIFRDAALTIGDAAPRLAQRLRDKHGVRIVTSSGNDTGADKHRYDAATRTLHLADFLRPGQQAFQMSFQPALLEAGDVLDALLRDSAFTSDESRRLARMGLANYFAVALTMPYVAFLQSAEELAYDIERLANRLGVGFEAVRHRLSTLQRPGMPDERSYFWIARQVVSGPIGFGRPQKTFAVGLGCDLPHAHRLVYSRGLDPTEPDASTRIGLGCKVCERRNCAQRAFVARAVRGDTNRMPIHRIEIEDRRPARTLRRRTRKNPISTASDRARTSLNLVRSRRFERFGGRNEAQPRSSSSASRTPNSIFHMTNSGSPRRISRHPMATGVTQKSRNP